MKIYKKYSNRKIYCLEKSKYVGLQDIFNDLKQGADVIVKMHGSEKDVTNEVLRESVARFADLDNKTLAQLAKKAL